MKSRYIESLESIYSIITSLLHVNASIIGHETNQPSHDSITWLKHLLLSRDPDANTGSNIVTLVLTDVRI